jgi:hypothetical protein
VNDETKPPEAIGKDFLDLIERRISQTSDLATKSRLRALQMAASEVGRGVLGGLLAEFCGSLARDAMGGPSAPGRSTPE